MLACLRINRGVAAPTARLTADLPGSAVIGRDLHPLGSELNFVKSPHDSLLPDRHCLVATRKVSLSTLIAVGQHDAVISAIVGAVKKMGVQLRVK